MRAWLRRLARFLGLALLGWVGLSILLVLMFRVVPVGGSMVMAERKLEAWLAGESLEIQHQWRAWPALADSAKLAVLAAEDQRFPDHHGVDFIELRRAVTTSLNGGELRGASTISQQTAKNLFLWTGRSWVRKALEAWFTLWLELLWPKERILEVYLNIVEWDDGVFGLEAASQHYFGVPASALSTAQASRLAAILPNPRGLSASQPIDHVLQRSRWIRGQMYNLGHAYLDRL
ncbi:monofunctional biosynthetic peptidoglycan transglycosylase [Halomonas sp. 18H]|uniref:monofunctional biosynthetic peptidoglycan transglycosylase n=1 Tax=Halomonas almeriensis TaxID=308163 RepID=UPI00222FE862|nr:MULTISPECIES: monofunctional biosynthetic peptidoglycan transglycosylase [Halomonas]MCW4149419.1 monofunctional biosynthetic peptidoglycan transglycosylase [Halomonas sp. 18H]MDN3553635.1 monofunctional biosynthetic peptidoglycan transglycosylase [Halomonas almeriensis]